MKKYLISQLGLLLILLITGCIESEDIVTGDTKEGGMIVINEQLYGSIIYSKGLPKQYAVRMEVMQGRGVFTRTVNVYKSFYSANLNSWSNEALLVSLPVTGNTAGGVNVATPDFDFSDLREGLILDGDAFPIDDSGLEVGDFWQLKIESVLSDGRKVVQVVKPKMVISGRYAGTYRVVESEYYRIGTPRSDVAWPGTLKMESINNTTYKQTEYFGPFSGNVLYWTVDENLDIDYPVAFGGVNQNSGGNSLITCSREAASMTNVHCGSSNKIVNDGDGKDRLTMSYGYMVDGSGPREMYQVLEKIVN